jgi:hypothetical protein
MEKMSHDATIYRLPPCKEFPKGMRVYKSNIPEDSDTVWGQKVRCVKDGKMWYTKQPLMEEK